MEKIIEIPRVFSSDWCREIIAFAEGLGFVPAGVERQAGHEEFIAGIRNNYRATFDAPLLASELWPKIKNYAPSSIEGNQAVGLNEKIKIYKYSRRQRFMKHTDRRITLEGRESRYTVLVYLSNDFIDGETVIIDDGVEKKFKPNPGDAICFIHELEHIGRKVIGEGIKYVLRTDIFYSKV